MASKAGEGFINSFLHLPRPLSGNFGGGGRWRECLVGGRTRQDGMHFAKSAANCRNHCIAVGKEIGFCFTCWLAWGETFGSPAYMVEGPRPGVAFIANKAKRNSKRRLRRVRTDTDDIAKQWRRIGKALLGEIAAHFRFRMNAGGNAPRNLEHQGSADSVRVVVLFGREPIEVTIRRYCEHAP